MTKKSNKANKKINEDYALKAKLERYWNTDSGSRKNADWQWFEYDLWYLGYHYAKWDKNTQQIITQPKKNGRPQVVINKTYSVLRAVRNYVLRNRPRAEATPLNLTEENINQVVKLNKFLDYLHDKLGIRDKQRDSLLHALKYSVGFWQVLWNEDKQEVEINVIDPFDLYWESSARSPQEAKRAILAVRRDISALRNDPLYKDADVDWDSIKADNLQAASNLKARILQQEKGAVSFNEDKKDNGSVIVKEYWLKEADESGQEVVKIITMAGNDIIRNETTDLDCIPFFRLRADSQPLQMYGIGWVKNLIPLNKQLNRLESQIAEYNDIMNKGKWIEDKGAGTRVINNENGQIIQKKRGFNVSQVPIAPLSNAIFSQIQNLMRYFEEIGAMNEASQGRIPTGATSGKAIEALQVGDANNMSELVENMEVFLEDVFEYVLKLCSQKYQFVRNVIPVTQSGERQFIKVIGESAQNKPDGATVINKDNIVDIKISSWLANTAEARRDILKELFQLQAIDQQTLLEGYQIGAVADIIQRTKQQKDEQQQSDLQAKKDEAGISQPPSSGPQQAVAIIRQVLNGQVPQLPEKVSPDFVSYFDTFMEAPEAQNLSGDIKKILQNLRDQAAQVVDQQQ